MSFTALLFPIYGCVLKAIILKTMQYVRPIKKTFTYEAHNLSISPLMVITTSREHTSIDMLPYVYIFI